MFEGAQGIVVAVSGGPDSVALLDMLIRIVQTDYKSEIKLHVAHLNHQLRGQESTEDAEFVCALAERLNLTCSVDARDVRSAARSRKRGIEETAREIRYNFLIDVARRFRADRIATGHTMSDQAETFLMRLARGTGLRGLASMRAVSDVPVFPPEEERECESARVRECEKPDSQIVVSFSPFLPFPYSSVPLRLIRPLLGITREEVEEYCRECSLDYRTDSSNLEMDYARNRVRHRLLPAIRELNPRAVEAIARTAEIAAFEQDALSGVIESLMREAAVEKNRDNSRVTYSVASMRAQSVALRRRMIIEALKEARKSVGPEFAEGEIELRHIAEVERLIDTGKSGSRIHLPGGIEVWREFDSIVFLSRQVEIESYEFELSSDNYTVEAGGLRIELLRGQSVEPLNILLERAKDEKRQGKRDWMMAVLDDELMAEKLIVRTRVEGERAVVLGHSKTKKLKKLMIGHRIAPSRRKLWPVVATPDGRYVWSPGLPPASEFAPHNKSRQLALMQASEI